MKTNTTLLLLLSCFALAAIAPNGAFADTNSFSFDTGFTHQGRLKFNGKSANGLFDLRFTLYTNLTDTVAIAPNLCFSNSLVSAGLYRVDLDFGDVFLGGPRYIETAVQSSTNRTGFQPLSPRLPVTAVPYALWARRGGSETWSVTHNAIYDDDNCALAIDSNQDGSFDLYGGVELQAVNISGNIFETSIPFGAPASAKRVDSVKVLILNHFFEIGGSADGHIDVQIRSLAGALRHIVSLETISATPTNSTPAWQTFKISQEDSENIVRPGEYLLLHISGGAWVPNADGYAGLYVYVLAEASVHEVE